jgi:hypothetical protein
MTDAFRLYLFTPALDRHFLVPDDASIPAGELTVGSSTGEEWRVDPEAVAPYEVSREEALADVRGQVERSVAGLVDLLAGAVDTAGGTLADPERLAGLLGLAAADLPELGSALRGLAADVQMTLAAVASGQPADLAAVSARLAARGSDVGQALGGVSRQLEQLRLLETPAGTGPGDDSTRDLGRRIDELVARLERTAGTSGRLAERGREQRQAEYRRDARSAIADSLREAGFTPLDELRGHDR